MSRARKSRSNSGDRYLRNQTKRALIERCETCGKVRYPNRKEARFQAKRLYPGEHMSTYRCGEYWHIGHIPWEVRIGDQSREEYQPRPPRRQAG